MNITIYGRIPSKKNSVVMFVRGGKLFKMPSNDYRKWHKDASGQLMQFRAKRAEVSNAPRSVSITLFAPDNRKADLTNKAESVMDLLTDNGFIPDDNWFEVGEVLLSFGGVDKEKPRAEICIKRLL